MREPIFPTRTRAQIAADNQAELESWIAERAAELAARGIERGEARRQAHAEFGDAEVPCVMRSDRMSRRTGAFGF